MPGRRWTVRTGSAQNNAAAASARSAKAASAFVSEPPDARRDTASGSTCRRARPLPLRGRSWRSDPPPILGKLSRSPHHLGRRTHGYLERTLVLGLRQLLVLRLRIREPLT